MDSMGSCCLKCAYEETKFIQCAYWNKKTLKKEMGNLTGMLNDVRSTIDVEMRDKPGTERKMLDRVNVKEKEVTGFLKSCDADCSYPYTNGIKLLDLITDVQKLLEERDKYHENLVRRIPINPLDSIPNLETPMVGKDSKLSEILDHITTDSQVKTIGIWGAGGIGKTTLLKSIKVELKSKNPELFFYIIWIKLSSQNNNILEIQKQIANCISLLSFRSEDKKGRATELRNVLRRKKTLVLIDNVWNEFEYKEIGIPFGVDIDNVKIVLTARSERVCTDMRAQKIVKLDYLDKKESLQLFENISSDHVDLKNHNIRQRVDEILEKCGGLPLAIVIVARTVRNYTRVEQWGQDAVEDCLRNQDVERKVMERLKRSYDKLKNNEVRSCLMYLSLYPEGYNIPTDKLIVEWIGEGLFDISNKISFQKSRVKGIESINELKSFGLVESGFSDYYDVKVHGVIREMLCWISKNNKREVLLVCNKDHEDVSIYKDWHVMKGIHVNERQLKCLPRENGMSLCPNLTTVIVEANPSNPIGKFQSEDFFHIMPSLRVLDLSCTGLVELPKSIGKLGELRHLNLRRTPIKMLPEELGNLKKLECLDLGDTPELESIPDVAISQLSMLQFLNLHNTGYRWDSEIINETEHRPLTLEDLRELKNLEELGVDVLSNSHLNTILANQNILLESIARIKFFNIEFTAEDLGQPIKLISERFLLLKRFPLLKRLVVEHCSLPGNILEIKDVGQLVIEQLYLWNLEISSVVIVKDYTFHSLEYLQISKCGCLKEVSWTAQLPSLQWLTVENSNGVEELVATGEEEEIEEERDSYFPKLLFLHIKDMENLHSIYRRNRPLLFPKLKKLYIGKCPQLKGLSFGRDSAKGIEMIKCTQSQWDSLEWEDDQVMSKFLPYVRVPP